MKRIRFENAPDLEFSANPQNGVGMVARVYRDVLRLGSVISFHSNSRGMYFRVYDNAGRCRADCGQFENTFAVLRGMKGNQK